MLFEISYSSAFLVYSSYRFLCYVEKEWFKYFNLRCIKKLYKNRWFIYIIRLMFQTGCCVTLKFYFMIPSKNFNTIIWFLEIKKPIKNIRNIKKIIKK